MSNPVTFLFCTQVAIKGQKWKKLQVDLNRSADSCRDKYREICTLPPTILAAWKKDNGIEEFGNGGAGAGGAAGAKSGRGGGRAAKVKERAAAAAAAALANKNDDDGGGCGGGGGAAAKHTDGKQPAKTGPALRWTKEEEDLLISIIKKIVRVPGKGH